jgi:hypothetical protein
VLELMGDYIVGLKFPRPPGRRREGAQRKGEGGAGSTCATIR